MESQRKLRSTIEEAETKLIEIRLNKIHEKAKLNPNTIWEARKRAKGCKELEYNTYTEEGIQITDPEKTKEHIASYFEELYQAREGTAKYSEWTNRIKTCVHKALEKPQLMGKDDENQISEKEINQVIKKLKWNKSLGPDKIPNEMFIEADKETRLILKEIMETIHKTKKYQTAGKKAK